MLKTLVELIAQGWASATAFALFFPFLVGAVTCVVGLPVRWILFAEPRGAMKFSYDFLEGVVLSIAPYMAWLAWTDPERLQAIAQAYALPFWAGIFFATLGLLENLLEGWGFDIPPKTQWLTKRLIRP